jgi:asparagine synthase (glutamine-hydrolysing)
MCGICGFILNQEANFDSHLILNKMTNVLTHRGPDAEGFFESAPVFLGHRRLKIIDLVGGRQPMTNEDGSVIVVFNGEIYNHKTLREQLENQGHNFKSQSDTEVLAHLWEEYGNKLVDQLNGMFSFAIYDMHQAGLFLARDRMGQKPLYYSHQPGGFVFASELTSLMQNPLVPKEIDPASLRKYLLFDSIPSPKSILQNVCKLEPGCSLFFQTNKPTINRYYDISFPHRDAEAPDFDEACGQFRTLVQESSQKRLMSDVPLGVFLSGGIDSSTIVALLSKLMDPKQIKTFCIGFSEGSYDESDYARQIADMFGTTHHQQTLSPKTMIDLVPEIISALDEPLADNSLIPTFLLSKFARQHVTVALGGDGGDELALGYPTFQAHKIARLFGLLPTTLKKTASWMASHLPVSTANISLDFKAKRFTKGLEYDRFTRHFVWIGGLAPDLHNSILTPDYQGQDSEETLEPISTHLARCKPRDDFDALCYLYAKLYMADDILTKVDRASMMNSLEVRAPFLDPDVVQFLTSLPTSYKLHNFSMKHIIKAAMSPYLSDDILKRPKKGFGVPVADWLKGPLKNWAQDILNPNNIKRMGFFDALAVDRLWQEHQNGTIDHRKVLWSLIVFYLWLDKNLA